ncbi:MAG: hypothetical protein AAF497_16405 [Planctomycetota bacterium]
MAAHIHSSYLAIYPKRDSSSGLAPSLTRIVIVISGFTKLSRTGTSFGTVMVDSQTMLMSTLISRRSGTIGQRKSRITKP